MHIRTATALRVRLISVAGRQGMACPRCVCACNCMCGMVRHGMACHGHGLAWPGLAVGWHFINQQVRAGCSCRSRAEVFLVLYVRRVLSSAWPTRRGTMMWLSKAVAPPSTISNKQQGKISTAMHPVLELSQSSCWLPCLRRSRPWRSPPKSATR